MNDPTVPTISGGEFARALAQLGAKKLKGILRARWKKSGKLSSME